MRHARPLARAAAVALALTSLAFVGNATSLPTVPPAQAVAAPHASPEVPFYGMNVNVGITRLAVQSPQPAAYTSAVAKVSEAGVGVVRAGVYCSTPELNASGPVQSIDCRTGTKVDEVAAVKQLLTDGAAQSHPFTVAPIIQIDFTDQTLPISPITDDTAWRTKYYADLGYHLGYELGGKVPYFELGNEPDNTCIIPGPAGGGDGSLASHYSSACAERVRASILALQAGITLGAQDAGMAEVPKFAVGVSGPVHWGMTDVLWKGIDPAHPTVEGARPLVRWDYTVVHWYYLMGYGDETGDIEDQEHGFHKIPLPRPGGSDPAAQFRDRYGKPILLTEFGVDAQYKNPQDQIEYEFASDANRVQSFARIVHGLYGNAGTYNITGMFAFALTDETAQANVSTGKYGLVDENFDGSKPGRAFNVYKDFIADHPMEEKPPAELSVSTPTAQQVFPTTADVRFEGKAAPGYLVSVKAGGAPICTTTAAPTSGEWSCAPPAPLAAGKHPAAIAQSSGTVAPPPINVAFYVGPYEFVKMTAPVDGGTAVSPRPIYAGTGQVGASITVAGSTGRTICDTTVKNDGTWTCTSTLTLSAGTYTSHVTQDKDEPVFFTYTLKDPLAVTAPAFNGAASAPTPTYMGKGLPGANIQVKGNSGTILCEVPDIPADGVWSCTSTKSLVRGPYLGTVTHTLEEAITTAPIKYQVVTPATVTTPTTGQTIPGPKPVYSGMGEPGATITIRGNSGTVIATTTVKADGTWTATSALALVAGHYISHATETFTPEDGGVTSTINIVDLDYNIR